MVFAQSVFSFCDFMTASIFVASIFVFSLRLFLIFATRPWRRHRAFTYRRSQGVTPASDHSPPPYCTVCLQEAEEGDKMRRLTVCRHCFHADCIDPWFGEMSTCPLCRAEIPAFTDGESSALTVCFRRCNRFVQ